MKTLSISAKLLLLTSLCACTPRVLIGGKPVDTDDGTQAAENYYGPQLNKVTPRAEPIPLRAIFLVPDDTFVEANWVRARGNVSQQQRHFLRDFAKGSWLILARALHKAKLFEGLSHRPTLAGTAAAKDAATIPKGTLIIGHSPANKVVVTLHQQGEPVTILEKLKPGHEVAMLMNLLEATSRRLMLARGSGASGVGARAPKAAERAIVAVFNAQTKRIELPNALLTSIADIVATRLATSPRFRVIPRDQLRERLKGQKKKSYRQCFDSSCQIEIGRELAAQKSLAITIVKIGATCNVDLVLYDLKEAASEGAAAAQGKCTEEGIVEAAKAATAKLK